MKKLLVIAINTLNKFYNNVMLKRKHVVYPKNLVIHGRIHIHGSGNIRIGNNVTIVSCSNVNPVAGDGTTHLFVCPTSELSIGNHVGISNTSITARERITIGDHVLIGSNCMIADTDFHSLDAEERMIDDGSGVKTNPIVIEDHVFIGARSIILKGVTIGKNSIVGAGSVITKSIPENEIWAGNPARFIKKVPKAEG